MHHPPHRRWSPALLSTRPRLPRPRPVTEVVVATPVPVQLRVKLLAKPTGTPGERLVGITREGRLIASAPTAEPMIGPLATLLSEPVHLLLKARPTQAGVHSCLHALVPTRRAARALGLPVAACLGTARWVALPLGEFLLPASERHQPGDLRAEARAQLDQLLHGAPRPTA
jgi:hypothetical protein